MPRYLQAIQLTLLLALVAGCSNQHETEFGLLHRGMTKAEVLETLGDPTTTYYATDEARAGADGNYPERWQYGDNFSTRATGAVFPENAPSRVWVVYFGADGRVTEFREPMPDDFEWRDHVK